MTNLRLTRNKLEADAKWDGLKGYLTNTNIPTGEVYAAYHNLCMLKELSASQNRK